MKISEQFPLNAFASNIIKALIQAGAKPFAVGGCVRDFLLGQPFFDLDVEVYGLDIEQIHKALEHLGPLHTVGKSFGVLKIGNIDISLPRTENKIGRGHKAFAVQTNANLDFAQAALRRDFSINAMGIDLSSFELLDPHGGQKDLQAKILRHVSPQFVEDPLRVLRAAQFLARFNFEIHPGTLAMCLSMKEELSSLPKERIFGEIKKLILSSKPSIGFKFLRQSQALHLFSELEALIDCPQDPFWHPEGDVWIHTLMVIDEAVKIVRAAQLDESESSIIVTAALCHDLGKPLTTKLEDGRIRSKNHDVAGEKPTRELLTKMGFGLGFIEDVIPLVREHLRPYQLYAKKDEINDGTIRRLASRVSIERLCYVSKADFLGRTTKEALSGYDPSYEWLLERAQKLQVHKESPKPILQGRHLLQLGYPPGPKMGETLKHAFEAQLDGKFENIENAIKWLKDNI